MEPPTSWVRRLGWALAVPPAPYRFDERLEAKVRTLCEAVPPGAQVLNLGSGSSRLGVRVINVDLSHFAGVQVCADAERLPFGDGAFAGAVLKGLLEHVRSAENTCREVHRVLRPGGFLYVEVPFLQPYHQSPEDYRRFTLPGLRDFLQGYELLEDGVQLGPGATAAWVLREAGAGFLAFGSSWRYRKALALIGWLTFWLREIDRWTIPGPYLSNSASAVYLMARKPTGITNPPRSRM